MRPLNSTIVVDLNTIVVDLNTNEDSIPSFASVNKVTMQNNAPHTVQKIALVMQYAEQLKNSCTINYQNFQYFNLNFSLSLIDSSDGQVVSS